MDSKGLLGKPKNRDRDQTTPYPKPVLPQELPMRLKIEQKFKTDSNQNLVPEDFVVVTYKHMGKGNSGSFKVPIATLQVLWNAMQ